MRSAAATGLLLLVLAASGCSSGASQDSAKAGTGARDEGVASAPKPAASPSRAPEQSSSGGAAGSAVPAEQAVIRTADLVLKVKDVAKAADAAARVATGRQGLVAEQSIGDDQKARLQLRVPTDRFDAVLTDLRQLGAPVSDNRESVDVTGQVVDVQSRIATQRASVQRLRALMSEAKNVGDIVDIEGELTKREAELESMLAVQKKLADQTSLASISLSLLGPAAPAPTVEKKDGRGFLVGLRHGWNGLVATFVVVVTVLGALLPFLLLLGVLAVPGFLFYRRLRAGTARTGAATVPGGPPTP